MIFREGERERERTWKRKGKERKGKVEGEW